MKSVYLVFLLLVWFGVLVSCQNEADNGTTQIEEELKDNEELPEVKAEEVMTDDIRDLVRKVQWLRVGAEYHGELVKDEVRTPLSIFSRAQGIQVVYEDVSGNETRVHLRNREGRVELFEIKEGKTHRLEDLDIRKPINGTDFCLADIALLNLEGSSYKDVGEERRVGKKFLKVRVLISDSHSEYKIAYAVLHSADQWLFEVIGFDAQGKPLKRIQVTDFKKLKAGGYRARRMRIERIDPLKNKTIGCTFYELR